MPFEGLDASRVAVQRRCPASARNHWQSSAGRLPERNSRAMAGRLDAPTQASAVDSIRPNPMLARFIVPSGVDSSAILQDVNAAGETLRWVGRTASMDSERTAQSRGARTSNPARATAAIVIPTPPLSVACSIRVVGAPVEGDLFAGVLAAVGVVVAAPRRGPLRAGALGGRGAGKPVR